MSPAVNVQHTRGNLGNRHGESSHMHSSFPNRRTDAQHVYADAQYVYADVLGPETVRHNVHNHISRRYFYSEILLTSCLKFLCFLNSIYYPSFIPLYLHEKVLHEKVPDQLHLLSRRYSEEKMAEQSWLDNDKYNLPWLQRILLFFGFSWCSENWLVTCNISCLVTC